MCHFDILVIDVTGPQYLSLFACVHWPKRNVEAGVFSTERKFIRELANLEYRQANGLKDPPPQWHVGYRLYSAKMTKCCGLGAQDCAGS